MKSELKDENIGSKIDSGVKNLTEIEKYNEEQKAKSKSLIGNKKFNTILNKNNLATSTPK